MKTYAIAAFSLATTAAAAHPGHGQPGWLHDHAGLVADIAMIFAACLVAGLVVRGLWKVVSRAR